MFKQTRQEKLYDTVQLAREIFVRNISRYSNRRTDISQIAQEAFSAAEVFLTEQEAYANNTVQSKPVAD